MTKTIRHEGNRAGFALLLALGILGLLSMFGTVWLRYMVIEKDQSDAELGLFQARHIAEAGVDAAIAELGAALGTPRIDALLAESRTVNVPIYKNVRQADTSGDFEAEDWAQGMATITIEDECARVNLNLAPPRVLRDLFDPEDEAARKLIGSAGEAARAVRQGLPRLDRVGVTADQATRRWFTSVDELVTRGFLSAEALDAIGADLLTVYTAKDPAHPEAYLNVNTAPRAVMEAILGVDSATADQVIAARPFASAAQLSQAAGKSPSAFNVRPDAATPDAAPKELCFESRCFRITIEATLARLAKEPKDSNEVMARGWAEAVVFFGEDGRPQVRFWSDAADQEG